MTLGDSDVVLRLRAAMIAGALIGLDREIRDKPAGLRTLTLVSLGSAVRGLTTAASVWLAAAIGIACGLAYWPLVQVASAFGLVVLALEGIEGRLKARIK